MNLKKSVPTILYMVVGTNAALVDYFWSNFPYTAQKPVLLY